MDTQLMTPARALATRLAAGPSLVFSAFREIVRDAEDAKFADATNRVTKRQLPTVDTLYGSEDNQAGFKVFTETRDPVWKKR